MTIPLAGNCADREHVPDADEGDSLTVGLCSGATLAVIQKSVGMLRHIVFLCWLTQDQMGRFTVAQTWLSTVAPLIVLGLPASLCRYVEHYRRLGQPRSYLLRVTRACILIPMPIVLVGILFPDWFTDFIYRDAETTELVRLLAIILATVLAAATVNELLLSHRMFRVAAQMQFLGTMVFLGSGAALMALTPLRDYAVLLAFGLSNLTITLGGLIRFWPRWRSYRDAEKAQPAKQFWAKLLGYSLWNAFSGCLAGLFFCGINQVMIHNDQLTPREAEGMIGQLASGIFIPMQLMFFLLGLMGTTLFPYMSRDWERGMQQMVAQRFHTAFKILMLGFCAGSIAVLLFSPILFDTILHGRYDDGREILPYSLALYAWMTATYFSQYFVLCAERARAVCIGLLLGVVFVGLSGNYFVSTFGLLGAVIALTLGHCVSLIFLLHACWKNGMPINRSILIAALLPFGLVFGTIPAIVMLLAIVASSFYGNWLFSNEERALLLNRIHRIVEHYAPASFKQLPFFRVVTRYDS
ncbi:MAG: hypothetical protein RIS70_2161 [Planctomycetota bacterium]